MLDYGLKGRMTQSRIQRYVTDFIRRFTGHAFVVGLVSALWYLLRTGRKPSRAGYPCQIVARANGEIWLATYIIPALTFLPKKASTLTERRNLIILVSLLLIVSGAGWWYLSLPGPESSGESYVGSSLTGRLAALSPVSDIFVVSGTTGDDDGVERLVGLMGSRGTPFYLSEADGESSGPGGLIASDDVVLIKVNCQWDERGGTNTDLVKALIQIILNHPDGFDGEVVIADNGQRQYGSGGSGGSLDWERNNAEDVSQSMQDVVDSFAQNHRVSTYLWDEITTTRVGEYSDGDMGDGYVVNATASLMTGIMVSYPKFRTEHGTYLSLKHGVWDPETETYDGGSLKLINVPVLKTHIIYGITACVKHYMGVPSDRLTAGLGSRTHDTVGDGGMGTLMVETRFPVLNVLDAIWVNARLGSQAGPSTPYQRATRVDVIAASTDPVALDHWASKHILMEAAPDGDKASIDPDNEQPGSFGVWLRLSMDEIMRAGYQATVDEDRMNVYVSR